MRSPGQRRWKKSRGPILPVFLTNVHCGGKCVFCDQVSIEGVSMDHGDILDEFDQRLEQLEQPPGELAIYGGDLLGLGRFEIKSLIDTFMERVEKRFNLRPPLRISASPAVINEDKLEFIMRLGVSVIEVGVVSTDETILSLTKRGYIPGKAVSAVKLVKEMGFTTGVQFMAGLPGENINSFLFTIDQIFDLYPDFARLYPLLILEGTALGGDYLAGKFIPRDEVYMLIASSLFFLKSIFYGVNIGRVGLNESGLIRDKVLKYPYRGNLRQEGEGLALLSLISSIKGRMPEIEQILFPRKYETSLQRALKGLKGGHEVPDISNIRPGYHDDRDDIVWFKHKGIHEHISLKSLDIINYAVTNLVKMGTGHEC